MRDYAAEVEAERASAQTPQEPSGQTAATEALDMAGLYQRLTWAVLGIDDASQGARVELDKIGPEELDRLAFFSSELRAYLDLYFRLQALEIRG